MKTLLIAVLCLLALLQVSEAGNAPRRVSMMVPSAARRRAGAKPIGTLPSREGYVAPPWPPRHTGPKHPQPDIAGRVAGRSHKGLYIINGSNATVGQFPWMLGVFIDLTFFCGGSIIGERWVLTAGHCVDGGKAFEITAGTLMKTGGTEATRQVRTATAASAYRHPDYNSQFVDNDIGVIQVEKPFIWNENVVPVRLPSYSMALDMMVGKRATISGWGKTSDDIFNEGPPNLLYANLQIADGSICFGHYGTTWIPNKICIATKDEGKSTCQGDSGGPLVIKEDDGKWTEIGLTSFGDLEGCAKGLPVVFTRVASFLEFIETTTNIEVRG
ncbi:brachyurin-like [Frankliniella occidentalis]|uniref:Brachyurin-like n=1 Tax=Frankliniella occidentalis TaxID=133901 RepID=A0A6J1S8Q4_FRAOC|nr:brachyurin-like [Frankliniella occidentalis]